MSTSTYTPPPIAAYTNGAILRAIDTHEIGGGAGQPTNQRVTQADADVVARTKSQLRSGISTPGNTVFLPRDVSLNLTGDSIYNIARNVTLASDRGVNGSRGALLYTNSKGRDTPLWRGLFRTSASATNVRITGLRYRGPQYDTTRKDGRPPGYLDTNRNQDPHYARGINLLGAGGTVDNCELFGWTGTAISVGARGTRPHCTITRNYIHNCLMVGYGYGVSIKDGRSTISKNYFDACRHAVDGFGYHTCGYDCEDNIFGPKTYSHHVDMHCLVENSSGGSTNPSATNYDLRAGGLMRIRRNTFVNVRSILNRYSQAIVIRGYPAERCEVENNRFHNVISGPEPVANVRNNGGRNVPYRQPNIENPRSGWHRMHFRGNSYGPAEPYRSGVGAPIDLGAAITGVDVVRDVDAPPAHIPLWTDDERRHSVARGLDMTAEAAAQLRDSVAWAPEFGPER